MKNRNFLVGNGKITFSAIIVLICALFASLFSLFAADGFGVAENNGGAATTSCGGVSVYSEDTFAADWCDAVKRSIAHGSAKFTLAGDWTAQPVGDSTSFGDNPAEEGEITGFSNGRIYVPGGANVVLDLKGHTINRNLTSVESDGGVIYVAAGGRLEITDSSVGKTGLITGGRTLNEGGGALVEGELILSGGTIDDNFAGAGGGVYIGNGGSLAVGGGVTVSGNAIWDSGAVNNVNLRENQTIQVYGYLTNSEIWVSAETYTAAFTENYSLYHNKDNPENYFRSDNGKKVILTDGEAHFSDKYIVKIPVLGTDTFTYSGRSVNIVDYFEDFDSDAMRFVVGETATDYSTVGYVAGVALRDKTDYVWTDGTTETKEYPWRISKAELADPELFGSSLNYSTSAQKLQISYTGGVSIDLPLGWTISGREITLPAYTSGGSHLIRVTPDNNHCWSDGTFGPMSLNVNVSVTSTETTVYDLGTERINQQNLLSLMGRIMGKSTASYDELSAFISSRPGGQRYGYEIGAQVRLGGMLWNVAFATKTNGSGGMSGDVVVTLWLAASDDSVKFSDWSESNLDGDYPYPSNMYATSYVRSYLSDSDYSLSGTNLTTSGVQSAVWSNFIDTFRSYIATPSQLSYQEGLSGYVNEGYGNDPYSRRFAGFNAWSSDYLWLPSVSEAGTSNVNGIWGVDRGVCFNGGYYWLRSGSASDGANLLLMSDNSISYAGATAAYSVRPAFHLNLKQAAATAGMMLEAPTLDAGDGHDYLEYFATGLGSLTISSVQHMSIVVPSSFSRSGTSVTVFSGLPVGVYYFEFTPDAGYSWDDGTAETKYIPFNIIKKTLAAPAIIKEESSDGSLRNKIYTYDGSLQTADFDNFDGNLMKIAGGGKGRNAGTYHAVFVLLDKNNYQWDNNSSDNWSVEWEIEKAALELDFTYPDVFYGSPSSVPTVTGNIGKGAMTWTVSAASAAYATIDSSTGVITPNERVRIHVNLHIAESADGNYQSADRGKDIIINRAQLAIPTVDGPLAYTGNPQKATLLNFNDEYMQISAGSLTQTDVGSYSVVVELKNSVKNNYEWTDGTDTEKTVGWRIIEGVKVNLPHFLTSVKYSEQEQKVKLSSLVGLTVTPPTGWDLAEDGTVTVPAGASANSHVFSVQIKSGYEWTDGGSDTSRLIKLDIEQGDLDIGFSYPDKLVFGGESSSPQLTKTLSNSFGASFELAREDFNYAEISMGDGRLNPKNAGTVHVTMTVWDNNGNYNDCVRTIEVKIHRKPLAKPEVNGTYTYDGSESGHTVALNNYDAALMQKGGVENAVNAGDYVVTVSFSATEYENYEWTDGTRDEVELLWTIEKATPEVSGVEPAEENYIIGELLKNVALSGTATSGDNAVAGSYVWENPYVKLGETGTYKWIFVPTDINNYNTVYGDVTVNGAASQVSELIIRGVKTEGYDAYESFVLGDLHIYAVINGVETEVYNYTLQMPYNTAERNYFLYEDNGKSITATYAYNGINISGSVEVTVNRLDYNMGNVNWILDPEVTYTYDGTAKPVLIVGLPENIFTATITYLNNDNTSAGEHTAHVEFVCVNDNYNLPENLEDFKFTIEKATPTLSFELGKMTYGTKATARNVLLDGSVLERTAYVQEWSVNSVDGGTTDVATIDSGTGEIEPLKSGKVKVTLTVTLTDDYNPASYSLIIYIERAEIDLSHAKWECSGESEGENKFGFDSEYHGVSISGYNSDFIQLICENYTESKAGEYTARVTGYEIDEAKFYAPDIRNIPECVWEITRSDITDMGDGKITIIGSDDIKYTGAPIEPEISIDYNSISDEDYDIVYENNINAGEASLTVTAKEGGNFTGSKTITFIIAPAAYNFTEAGWDYSSEGFTYDGSERTLIIKGLPKGVSVTYKGNTATEVGNYTAEIDTITSDDANYVLPDELPENLKSVSWSISRMPVAENEIKWNIEGDGARFILGSAPDVKAFVKVGDKLHEFAVKYTRLTGDESEGEWSEGVFEVTLDLTEEELRNFDISANVSRNIRLTDKTADGESAGVLGDMTDNWWKILIVAVLFAAVLVVLIILIVTMIKRKTQVVYNDADDDAGFYDELT